MSSSHLVSLLYQLKNVVIVVHKLLFEARDLHHSVFILLQLELLMVIEKII